MTKERPILFSGPLIPRIQSGDKDVTRRLVKKLPPVMEGMTPHSIKRCLYTGLWTWHDEHGNCHSCEDGIRCPYGEVGDLLIVKENAWMWVECRPNGTTKRGRQKWLYVPLRAAPVHYCADHPKRPELSVVSPDTGCVWGWRKKLGRFLPGWASRLTLEVVSVRVERLQDITEEDARREGVARDDSLCDHGRQSCEDIGCMGMGYRPAFAELWGEINGWESWNRNDWCWRVEFRRVDAERRAA